MQYSPQIQKLKTSLGHLLRLVLSKLPASVFGDEIFEEGFSFTILTKNDPWFLESIFSIVQFADEIIIIDSSDDQKYIDYNKTIIEELGGIADIKYFLENVGITQARRKAKEVASRETIIHWDADMVAFDSGAGAFKNVKEFVNTKSGKKVVYFQLLSLFGDFDTVAIKPVDNEPWIFSNTVKELYKPRPGGKLSEKMVEGFTAPKYFRRMNFGFFGAVHMKWVMPPEKELYKKYQGYLLNEDLMRNFKDYDTLRRQFKNFKEDEEPVRVDYNEKLHGTFPRCLQRFVGLSYPEIIDLKLKEVNQAQIPEEVLTYLKP